MKLIYIFGILIVLFILYNIKKTNTRFDDDYSKFLKDKNIIIVGPAKHVNNGKFIDSFDIVIRLNKGLNLSKKEPKKYGSKTNIIYMADQGSLNILNKKEINNLDYIKFQLPKSKNESFFHPISKNEYNFYENFKFTNKILRTDKEYLNFEKEIQTRPNMGTTAIWDILRYPIKSLYITGITFNTTESSEHYYKNGGLVLKEHQKIAGLHNIKNMIDYCNNKVITDNRVKYDEEFKKSLNNFKNN